MHCRMPPWTLSGLSEYSRWIVIALLLPTQKWCNLQKQTKSFFTTFFKEQHNSLIIWADSKLVIDHCHVNTVSGARLPNKPLMSPYSPAGVFTVKNRTSRWQPRLERLKKGGTSTLCVFKKNHPLWWIFDVWSTSSALFLNKHPFGTSKLHVNDLGSHC